MWLRTNSRDYRATPWEPWCLIDVPTNDLVASFRSAADVTKTRVLLESVGHFTAGRSPAEVLAVALDVCEGLFSTRNISDLRVGDFGGLSAALANELSRNQRN